jgi:DNA-binding IclR family transcriptional regulator
MRPRVDWMNQTDDHILEMLAESGLELSPSVLAHNLEYSRSWVSRRLSKLTEVGLTEAVGSYYGITEKGRQYLTGDLDADNLRIENSSNSE